MRAVRFLFPALFALALLLPALHLSCRSSPAPTALPTATFTPPPTATPVPTATPSPAAAPQPTPTPPLHEADRDVLVALYHATGGPGWTNSNKWLTGAPLREWRGVATDAAGRVVRLELHDNGLTGEIPPELGNLTSLTGLGLGGNDLSGGIPPELGNLTSLVSLSLHSNRLSGGIPVELSGLASLMWLHLHSNEISGEIPPELGNLAELTYLELHENGLTGRIPAELGNLPYMETLKLADNQLSGQIPPELGELPELLKLTLTGNRFSGCVPVGLRNVTWENDAGALGLPLCPEEMALFQDAWGRFQVQIPADWEEEELETQEYLFHFQASSPYGDWIAYIVVVDSGSLSLSEYGDELESAILKENPERLVRSSFQTAQDIRAVVFEVSSEDDEALMSGYILDDDVGVAIIYVFPASWSEAGKELAYRSFDTFAPTPASQPTPETTATPPPEGKLAPLRLQDSWALVSSLTDAELICIGDLPETLDRVRAWPSQEAKDEMLRLIGCLSDETLARLFLAGFMPGPEPLSLETSECVRAAFAVIDPQEVMNAGLEDDPERAGRAMAASTVAATTATACLNDQEWERSIQMMETGPQERADRQCLMEVLGGPGEMAEAVRTAWEGDSAGMDEAAAACGLDREPATGQGPADPPPTPTGTPEPGPDPATPEPAAAPVITATILVAPVPPDIPEFYNSQWKHWVDADGDCQDTRQEVLVRESLSEVVFETDGRCRVATGWWHGAFTRTRVNNPAELDVVHRVPLRNAHRSGGWDWPADKKEEYANYLDLNLHLVAVAASVNRSRGAKGPEEWRPPEEVFWCEYALYWSAVKTKWELTMTREEANAVREMLDTCPGEVRVIEIKQ